MQSNLNKKGLSSVVMQVMLILIGVAAVSLLASYIFGFMNEARLSPKFSCSDMQINGALVIEKACYNSLNNELSVRIKRGDENFDIGEFYFVLSSEQESWNFICGSGCGGCVVPNSGETKTYYFNVSGMPEIRMVGVRVDSCGLGEVVVREC